jgi:hypothetical protein
MRFHKTHVTYEYHRVCVKRFLSLWYVRCKSCTYVASSLALSPNGLKHASTWASSSSNSIGCIKNYFLECGMFTEPVHLSCTYTNTVSKRTEMRSEFHPVRPKYFLNLWYVRRKPCTYLASRLALSSNGPNEFPLEPCHLVVPSGASKMISEPMVLWRKSCTYLAPTLTQCPNRPKWDSTLPTSPRSSIRCDQNGFWGYGMFGANHAPIVCQD